MSADVSPLELWRYNEIVILTGAGVSAASGLPTYRGPGGLWNETNVAEHATAAAIGADPRKVWTFFARLRREVGNAAFNPGHHALAWAQHGLQPHQRLTVITQNVDGLHQAAGSTRVVELHGSLRRSRCTKCDFSRAEELTVAEMNCPACPSCRALLRPDVVLFDEPLSVRAEWEAKTALRSCDLFLAVGTSGTVYPASNFVRAAEYAGARTIYVNLQPLEPPNRAFKEVHLGRAEEVLPALFPTP